MAENFLELIMLLLIMQLCGVNKAMANLAPCGVNKVAANLAPCGVD